MEKVFNMPHTNQQFSLKQSLIIDMGNLNPKEDKDWRAWEAQANEYPTWGGCVYPVWGRQGSSLHRSKTQCGDLIYSLLGYGLKPL